MPMPFSCRTGLHAWRKHVATLRPARLVCRCARCGAVKVLKRRQPEADPVAARPALSQPHVVPE